MFFSISGKEARGEGLPTMSIIVVFFHSLAFFPTITPQIFWKCPRPIQDQPWSNIWLGSWKRPQINFLASIENTYFKTLRIIHDYLLKYKQFFRHVPVLQIIFLKWQIMKSLLVFISQVSIFSTLASLASFSWSDFLKFLGNFLGPYNSR